MNEETLNACEAVLQLYELGWLTSANLVASSTVGRTMAEFRNALTAERIQLYNSTDGKRQFSAKENP